MNVLIADDHPLFRMGLRYALTAQGFTVIAEAADGHAALQLALTHRPDVALLDVKMPGLTGIEVAERLRTTAPGVLVALITTFQEPAIIQSARRAGARAYLSKETPPQDLARQLRALMDRPFDDHLPHVTVPTLTPREGDVLRLLADGQSNKEIARSLGVSPETVKEHLARMYVKLDAPDRVSALNKARTLGLIE
ncbi:response regulator transcription factor [Deinococcus maricopensis]|uniref:Two component transcriptional regulator, LuxR family n=1 Tax=Deinococcus maricopensis (strain DSM 21211 / LMG 22137 / NRRL B-23946 / LB-34) TaxID=709986 RepID=E8U5C0_DEIML|nr:response regulator transcription factor [Deinococcus maricopensis]ADV66259.1 two component transcriptional regulator, LuxR family [Deinococcus maricopensis DSM 21211]